MKKGFTPRKTESISSRAKKSWSKGARNIFDDSDAVPLGAVGMKPRVKDMQIRVSQDRFESAARARVIASHGKEWTVECITPDDESRILCGEMAVCTVSRSVVSENPRQTLLAVGDIVKISLADDVEQSFRKGTILQVEERTKRLSRKMAGDEGIEQVLVANAEQAVIVMSAAEPFYNKRLIDRYLIAAEVGELTPIICMNKIDLMPRDFLEEDLQVYTNLGVKIIFVCAHSGAGIEEFLQALAGKISVVSGPSGVGKSTIVNALLGKEIQRTTSVSEKWGKGMHTTTNSTMFALPKQLGGYIVDTPGIREFGMTTVEKNDVALYFHDFDEFRDNCRFMPCTHTHEPDCAIKFAVEIGHIDSQRYESYVNIFESLDS